MLPKKLSSSLRKKSKCNNFIFELCTSKEDSKSLNGVKSICKVLSKLSKWKVSYTINADDSISLNCKKDRIDCRLYNNVEEIPNEVLHLVKFWRNSLQIVRNRIEKKYNKKAKDKSIWFKQMVDQYALVRYFTIVEYYEEINEEIYGKIPRRVTVGDGWVHTISYIY